MKLNLISRINEIYAAFDLDAKIISISNDFKIIVILRSNFIWFDTNELQ